MRFLICLLALGFLAFGCGRPHEYFPLKMGNQWRYKVNTGMDTFIQNSAVSDVVPGEMGQTYEVSGNLGVNRLAWKDGVLWASTLGGDRFSPAIPLLDGKKESISLTWAGSIYASGRTMKAKGTLVQDKGNVLVDSQKRSALTTLLTITLPDRIVIVESSYVRGIGLVNQTQRTTIGSTDRFDRGLEYLGGP
ncbi:MAG: hypothetical protein ABL949_01480 [Fimbriimonadaceae bacterium]